MSMALKMTAQREADVLTDKAMILAGKLKDAGMYEEMRELAYHLAHVAAEIDAIAEAHQAKR